MYNIIELSDDNVYHLFDSIEATGESIIHKLSSCKKKKRATRTRRMKRKLNKNNKRSVKRH